MPETAQNLLCNLYLRQQQQKPVWEKSYGDCLRHTSPQPWTWNTSFWVILCMALLSRFFACLFFFACYFIWILYRTNLASVKESRNALFSSVVLKSLWRSENAWTVKKVFFKQRRLSGSCCLFTDMLCCCCLIVSHMNSSHFQPQLGPSLILLCPVTNCQWSFQI